MTKLNFEARTLDHELVREGLCAVGALQAEPFSKDLYFVVGGVAVQSYLPSSCRRATSDVDLAIMRPLNYEDFRTFSRPVVEYLSDKHYAVSTKKNHNSYQVVFSDKDSNAAVIEFARRNSTNLERIIGRLNKEFGNTRVKMVEGRDVSCRVASPEDLTVPKIVRATGALARHPSFLSYLEGDRAYPLTDEVIQTKLSQIRELREQAILHIGDPLLSEALRFVSDLYDVSILTEVVGFNDSYLKESLSRWSALKDRSTESERLMNHLLPALGNL